MICKVLHTFYGRDTRPVQWLNFYLSLVWLCVAIGGYTSWYVITLPPATAKVLTNITPLFMLVVVFTLCNFLTTGKAHQISKAFSFALGGLANLITANSYVTAYPPLDPMLIISVVLGSWVFCAVFFVLQCEGINGASRTKP